MLLIMGLLESVNLSIENTDGSQSRESSWTIDDASKRLTQVDVVFILGLDGSD